VSGKNISNLGGKKIPEGTGKQMGSDRENRGRLNAGEFVVGGRDAKMRGPEMITRKGCPDESDASPKTARAPGPVPGWGVIKKLC